MSSELSTSRHAVFMRVFPSVALPMFLAVIDQTIVATALPSIASALGSHESISWVVIGYLIAATIAAPVYGRLGDALGKRRFLTVALVVMFCASIACALATSITMLTIARVFQGLGGGGLMALSQALIGESLPPRDRVRYQGYLATVAVCANALGPVIGGILTETVGWRAIFLANLPVSFVALLLVLRLPRGSASGGKARLDVLGLIFFASFVATALLLLEQVRAQPRFGMSGSAILLAVGLASLALFIWQETRAPNPLLPSSLLRHPAIWRSGAIAACHGATFISLLTFTPIYLWVVRDASAMEIGLMLLPMAAGVSIGSVATGRLVNWTGRTAIFPSIGLPIALGTLLFLAIWMNELSLIQLACTYGLLAVALGTVMGVVQVTVQIAAGPTLLGTGAGSVQFSRSLGGAFGTALVSVILFSIAIEGHSDASTAFASILQHDNQSFDTLSQATREAVRSNLGVAFRYGFLAIAGYVAIASVVAWSMPIRRV